MLADTLVVICISVFTAFLGEGITWLLVYRTDKYKKLQAEVDKHSKKLEKQRDTTSENKIDKAAKKRLGKQEERLKVFTRDLNAVKIKSMFATAVIFTSLFSVCSSVFDGRVVCKLPFTPISWLYGMSHRNLNGNDFTDCSFIFLYIICTMSIRQNVQKMLGFSPSRAANQEGVAGLRQGVTAYRTIEPTFVSRSAQRHSASLSSARSAASRRILRSTFSSKSFIFSSLRIACRSSISACDVSS